MEVEITKKKGTGKMEQKVSYYLFPKTKVAEFRASVKKDIFERCLSRRRQYPNFQSHVFKHEFFPFPIPFLLENYLTVLLTVFSTRSTTLPGILV
jgi:hypothetical protein